jgi:NAD(P)H-dependent flavin oxidoreductase YrpB (nitropropane dioxygenase family)
MIFAMTILGASALYIGTVFVVVVNRALNNLMRIL